VTFAEVGSKGMFTKEIEEALVEGRIDLAVHSLKDLPTELAEPFALAATPPRVDPRDAFVSAKYMSLAELPQGARVGTSSQRRRAQLKALRPDINIVEFRGNVDTRLRKLAEDQVDAILLAAAGLERLGKTDWLRERLTPNDFCPAAGQGSLAIETRKGDVPTLDAIGFLDDTDTRFAVTAERAALAALGGGCQVPIGIHCRMKFQAHHKPLDEIFAVVASPETGEVVRIHHSAERNHNDPEAFGRHAAKMLLQAGAGPLLQSANGYTR
jgi:hydroxymethylbilane synthase